jgi:transcriptional regulator with XRE-family HTH domain
MTSLSKRIIECRAEKAWSQSDLRRAAKIKSVSTLSELESGKRTESPQLPTIAAALGVEVLWLQHGTGPKRRKNTPSVTLASCMASEIAELANDLPAKQQAELLHYLRFAKMLRDAGVSDDRIDAIHQSSG